MFKMPNVQGSGTAARRDRACNLNPHLSF